MTVMPVKFLVAQCMICTQMFMRSIPCRVGIYFVSLSLHFAFYVAQRITVTKVVHSFGHLLPHIISISNIKLPLMSLPPQKFLRPPYLYCRLQKIIKWLPGNFQWQNGNIKFNQNPFSSFRVKSRRQMDMEFRFYFVHTKHKMFPKKSMR